MKDVGFNTRTLITAFALAAAMAASAPLLGVDVAFSTYLPNGLGPTYEAVAVATDPSGAVYVTGLYSPLPDYPFPWPLIPYVMKLSPDGEILYTTIFPSTGATGSSSVAAIAVDAQGQAYIAGGTGDTLPQIGGLDAAYRGTGYDAFAAKLGANGEILYLTTLGTSSTDVAYGVAVDAQGAIYVAGVTESSSFPRVGSVPLPSPGGGDAFVVKLVPGNPAPVWSAAFGGTSYDWLGAIDTDPAGNVYLTGPTQSTDFPTVAAFQAAHRGGIDGYAVKLTPAGQVIYSTFLGGARDDFSLSAAADAAGNVWLGGSTESADFPLKNPLQSTLGERSDGFVLGLDSGGELTFSTLFGGSYIDSIWGIDVDPSGVLHFAGSTDSSSFPLKDPFQASCVPPYLNGIRCVNDAFAASLDPHGPSLLFSTYLGGSVSSLPDWEPYDFALAVAADRGGNFTVVGGSYSTDFPLVNPIFTTNTAPVRYASFVTRFLAPHRPPDCSAAAASPATIWLPNGRMVPVAIQGLTDDLTVEITGITQDEPGTAFSGIGTATARVKAERDGKGDGRVYRILFDASDAAGGTCAGEVTVCVPHDRGRGSCRDGRLLY